MLAALLLTLFLDRQNPQTVELENGGWVTAIGGGKTGKHLYWGCQDTYLDQAQPNQNFGDSAVLEGGPGHVILIKFGDLERLGRHKVTKATLYLTTSEGGKAALASVRQMLVPWGEGPLRRPFFTEKSDIAAQWSATWRNRHADPDGVQWQQAGASGALDSQPLQGVTAQDTGAGIAINGLEPAIQSMLDRWYDNNGLALTFSGPIEFFSSKNLVGRPHLVLQLEDAPAQKGPDLSVTLIEAKYATDPPADAPWPKNGDPVTYVAHVQNVGDAPAQPFSAAWNIGESLGSRFDVTKTLAPGEETTVETSQRYKANPNDHRLAPIGLRITARGSDASQGNDYLEIQEDAVPITVGLGGEGPDAAQAKVRLLNDVILPESRFSFAPEGCVERFRIAAFTKDASPSIAQILAPAVTVPYAGMQPKVNKLEGHDVLRDSADRWPGILGGGYTGNDITVPGEIQLPYEAYYDGVFDNFELKPTGLLAATEVAAMQHNIGKPLSNRPSITLPGTVLLRVLDLDGNALANANLSFYQEENGAIKDGPPTLKLTAGDNGTVLLPSRSGDQFGGLKADGSNGVYLVACTFNGVTDYRWLKAWQLNDARARTDKPAVFTELRFNVPVDPVDPQSDLAAKQPVTDSAGDSPASLSGLVDASDEKAVSLPNKKGDWVEIDLGKDQEITEVDLIGKEPKFWQRFDILTYFGGQNPDDARPFGHEIDWAWNLKTRPDVLPSGLLSMPYRGSGKSVRYVRLVCREPGKDASLSEIRILGAKAPGT